MNRRQNAVLTKGKRLMAVFLKFALIITGIPKLQNYVTSYSGHVTAADGFKDEQARDIKGYAELKKSTKEDTVKSALVMSGYLYAFAYDTGDKVLQKEMELVKSTFATSGEASLAIFKNVRTLATTNTLALADYGMTPAMLTDYSTSVDAVDAELNTPKAAIDHKHYDTSSFEAELEASEEILHNGIEKLMPQFETSQPEFFSEFNSANNDTILGSHKTRNPIIPMGSFKIVLRNKTTLDLIAEGLVKIDFDEEIYIYKSTLVCTIEEPIGVINGIAMAINCKPTNFTGTVTAVAQTIEVLMEPA